MGYVPVCIRKSVVGAEVLCLSPQAEFNNLRNDPDTLYISLALCEVSL